MCWVIRNHIERTLKTAHSEGKDFLRVLPFLYILPMSFIEADHDAGFRKKRRRPLKLFFVVFLTSSIILLADTEGPSNLAIVLVILITIQVQHDEPRHNTS